MKHSPESRLKAVGTLICVLLIALPTALSAWADQTAVIEGTSDVRVKSCTSDHSRGASAGIKADGAARLTMEASLSAPGEWASYTFTVENIGNTDVTLTRVSLEEDLPDCIRLQTGISKQDEGEILSPGECCTVTAVLVLDPKEESEQIDASGSFTLTLRYEAVQDENRPAPPPKTGDKLILSAFCAAFLLTVIRIVSRHRVKA